MPARFASRFMSAFAFAVSVAFASVDGVTAAGLGKACGLDKQTSASDGSLSVRLTRSLTSCIFVP
jgi:hypothetical protein